MRICKKFALFLPSLFGGLLYSASIEIDEISDLNPANLDAKGFKLNSLKEFHAKSDSLNSNDITWNYESEVDLSAIFGSYNPNFQDRHVTQNNIRIKNGKFQSPLFKIITGYTLAQGSDAINNLADIQNIKANEIYGGYSASGDTISNSTDVAGAVVADSIYGGYSDSGGNAIKNRIFIRSTNVNSNLIGGRASQGNANQNRVSANNSTIKTDVFGGYVLSRGDTLKNQVLINGGLIEGNLLGGRTGSGSASENIVTIDQNTQITQKVYAGYVDKKGDALNNKAVINSGLIKDSLIGGRSEEGRASQNEAVMFGGEINTDLFGGYVLKNGDSNGNSVVMHAGSIGRNLLGGRTYNGNANENLITINENSLIGKEVYAGYVDHQGDALRNVALINGAKIGENLIGGRTNQGNANQNRVSANNSTIKTDVFGGYVLSRGDTLKNQVLINGGLIEGNLLGGRTGSGSASQNEVVVNDNALVKSELFGGYADMQGKAIKNRVIINSAVVEQSALGGRVSQGEASENEVVAYKDAHVKRDIFGGYVLTSGDAVKNLVKIDGARVDLGIYGGYTASANANENIVTITSNARLNSIYGGYSKDGEANRNIVNLDSSYLSLTGKIYGGDGNGGDKFTGNTLNIRGKNITAANIANFEFLNFYIPTDMSNGEVVLNLTDAIAKTDLSSSKIAVGLVSGGSVKLKDKFILINSVSGINYPADMTNYSGRLQSGISAEYEFELQRDGSGKKLYAVISSRGKFLPYPKNVLETTIAELYVVSRGFELLGDAILNVDQNGVFANLSASKVRLNSGSHVDVRSVGGVAGVLSEFNRHQVGVFLEFGGGGYDSYNDFGILEVRGRGDFKFYGAGLIAKFALENDFYTDTGVKLGKINTDYENDLKAAIKPQYSATRSYYAAHFKTGKTIRLNESENFDVYAKVNYTKLGGKDIEVALDRIRLKASDSLIAKFAAVYNRAFAKNASLYAGAALQREFKGEARGYNLTFDYDISSPSIKGNSAFAEVGTKLKFANGISLDFGLKAITGKTKGLSGGINAKWNFR